MQRNLVRVDQLDRSGGWQSIDRVESDGVVILGRVLQRVLEEVVSLDIGVDCVGNDSGRISGLILGHHVVCSGFKQDSSESS